MSAHTAGCRVIMAPDLGQPDAEMQRHGGRHDVCEVRDLIVREALN